MWINPNWPSDGCQALFLGKLEVHSLYKFLIHSHFKDRSHKGITKECLAFCNYNVELCSVPEVEVSKCGIPLTSFPSPFLYHESR